MAEVLVAITILGVSIMSMLAVLPEGLKMVTVSGRQSTMNHLAQRQIDQLKAVGYADASLTSGSHPAAATSYPVSGFPDYSLTWTVAVDSPVTNVKKVTVTVGYRVYDASGTALATTAAGRILSDFQFFVTQ